MLRRWNNHRSHWRWSSTFLAVLTVWLVFGGLRSSAQTLLVFDQPVDTKSSDTRPGETPPVSYSVLEQAQGGSTASYVRANGFYAGIGPSYNTVNFGTQDVFAVGTSETIQS